MRSDDSYNYSELCSNSVAWQQSFLGPIVYSWESTPTPTGISRCRVPGGGDLATNSTIRVGLFMTTLSSKTDLTPDLWKIELSLSCASSLTPNLFSLLTPPHSSVPKEGKQTNQQSKKWSFGGLSVGQAMMGINDRLCSSSLLLHAWQSWKASQFPVLFVVSICGRRTLSLEG